METLDTKKLIKAVIPILIALFSVFVVAKYAASTEVHAKTIASLDEKKVTVMELTAASTAASAAITLIPGDTGTPIADKLADLSSYFLVVLCAIYLEKYLLTITGYASFTILIPLACVLYSISVFAKDRSWNYLAKKLLIFGIAIFLVIPASIKVSDLIETTYQSSIEETIDAAKETTEEISAPAESEEQGIFSGIISKVQDGLSGATTKFEQMLNHFLEALAVMLVTSCVIPIVVLLFFVWLVKLVLGVNPGFPGRGYYESNLFKDSGADKSKGV